MPMIRDKWESMRKTARNEALYAFVLENQDLRWEDVGKEFNISKQRAHEIFQIVKKKKAAVEEVPAA